MSAGLQLAKHDQSIGVFAGAIPERARNTPDGFKAVAFPQGYGAGVGRNDEIEDHAFETKAFGLVQGELKHGAGDALALRRGIGDEAAVAIVAATTRPVALDIKGAQRPLIFDDVNVLGHPVGQSILPAGVRVDGIGVTGPKHRFEHRPNGTCVGLAGASNVQNVNSRLTAF